MLSLSSKTCETSPKKMGIFSCFQVLLPSKWKQNKITPVLPPKFVKQPWKSLISTSYSVISWDAGSQYKPKVINKPGGLSFGVNLKDGTIDIFSIPQLPPKRLPPINREDIASLRKPKKLKRKGKTRKAKLSTDERLASAKVRRNTAETERREKTLRRLRMVVPE